MTSANPAPARRRITLERDFPATPDRVWALWTTKAGIESWWGPDGFRVEVDELDVRPGGLLVYRMIAEGVDQRAFLEAAGMPQVTITRVRYEDVEPPVRLAYVTVVDFVPRVEPYESGVVLRLQPSAVGCRLTLTIDAMHDDHWTDLAVRGWEAELGRLQAVLSAAG